MIQSTINKRYIFYILLFLFCIQLFAKREINFLAEDGLNITADLYFKGNDLPYILMFHQHESSRGEYNEIAEKLMDLGYNCLAVDLRSGSSVNYVENKTAEYARNHKYANTFLDAEKDVKAAIEYAFKKSNQPVVLMGSYYSAGLCLKQAVNNGRVSAIIAYETGEYLRPDYILKEHMSEMDKPIYYATAASRMKYANEIFSETDKSYLTSYRLNDGACESGIRSLWSKCENNKEYWLSLLMFFSKL